MKGNIFAHFCGASNNENLRLLDVIEMFDAHIGSSNLISLYHNIKMAKMTFWVIPKTPGQKVFKGQYQILYSN